MIEKGIADHCSIIKVIFWQLFFLLHLPLITFSQFKPGYLVTTDNDTIHGEIFNKSCREIIFKDSSRNKMTYTPGGSVKGFVRNGMEFITEDLPDKQEKGFLAILERGTITLYGIVVPDNTAGSTAGLGVVGGAVGGLVAAATDGSAMNTGLSGNYYSIGKFYLRKGQDDQLAAVPKGDKKFNAFIMPYLKDHIEVVKAIPADMFYSANLISIIRQYNSFDEKTRVHSDLSPVQKNDLADPGLKYLNYQPKPSDRIISRKEYLDKLYGFWLGACIGNWTGLVTEMDKIGNTGEIKTGPFYTRDDWGKPDLPNIWSPGTPNNLSPVIGFVFEKEGGAWGSDDDTDIEYIYQDLLYTNKTSVLTGTQIRDGWMKHIKAEEENFLWVSNQKAFDLMKAGIIPPETSLPANNPEYMMIDAQLTTEIFGLFAPARPDVALKMACLPVRTTARYDAAWIAEFYILMHSFASATDPGKQMKDKILWMADQSRKHLPDSSYSAGMYDFVKGRYLAGIPWEQTRDEIYQRYQVEQADGYDLTSKHLYCNACSAAGINFAASLVSLFYGEGDFRETIKIGVLAGWDSDNPTATWGGLLGFMIGKKGIEASFQQKFASEYNIGRTRIGFPDNGKDTFENMARTGVFIIDRVVQEQMGGGVDLEKSVWYIPET